jgi:RND family efflux transporter MFP subunit
LLVLALGIAVMISFIRSKEMPKPKDRSERVTLVEIKAVAPVDHPVTVRAQGIVRPARQVTITPQVAGRLTEVHPSLVVGGRISKGDLLFRIDAREYGLAAAQQKAQVAQAEFKLAMETGRAGIAEREWRQLQGDAREGSQTTVDSLEKGELARRAPHLKAAEAALDGARAALARARLNIERTRVRAPFDALVVEERIEVGQVVGPQTPAATLVATDAYWVEVSLPASQLGVIEVPGARAVITRRHAGHAVRRTGSVVRTVGSVERAGRLARIIVEVQAPTLIGDGPGEPGLPLLLQDFVEVEITGRTMTGVYDTPRTALLEGDRLHLMGPDDRLIVRDVQVGWRARDSVYVTAGLEPGERLVLTPLPAAAPGIALRVEVGAGEPPAPKAAR